MRITSGMLLCGSFAGGLSATALELRPQDGAHVIRDAAPDYKDYSAKKGSVFTHLRRQNAPAVTAASSDSSPNASSNTSPSASSAAISETAASASLASGSVQSNIAASSLSTIISASNSQIASQASISPENTGAPPPTPVAVLVMGTGTYTIAASGNAILFGQETISAGEPAKTVDGQAISLGSSGLVIDEGQSIASTFPVLPPGATATPNFASPPPEPTTTDAPLGAEGVILNLGDTSFTYVEGAPEFNIGSTKISAGGAAVTVGQSVVSLSPKGVIVDGKAIDPSPLSALPPGYTPTKNSPSASGSGFRQFQGDKGEPTSAAEDLNTNSALIGVVVLTGIFVVMLS